MKLDEIDFEILFAFICCAEGSLTSTDVAKILYDPKNRDELIKKNTLITYRLKKLVESQILNCEQNTLRRINFYSLSDERITQGLSSLKVNGIQIDMGNAVVIRMPNESYIVQFFEDVDSV